MVKDTNIGVAPRKRGMMNNNYLFKDEEGRITEGTSEGLPIRFVDIGKSFKRIYQDLKIMKILKAFPNKNSDIYLQRPSFPSSFSLLQKNLSGILQQANKRRNDE